jgi:hypothetical protein
MKLQAKKQSSMFAKFENIGDMYEGEFVEFNEQVPSKYGDEDQLILKGKNGPLMIRCTKKLTAIIKDNVEVITRGSWLKIKYIADIPTDKGNPMKDYEVDIEPPDAKRSAELAAESNTADDTPF